MISGSNDLSHGSAFVLVLVRETSPAENAPLRLVTMLQKVTLVEKVTLEALVSI
ncbi:MAG: hypothetical protein AB8B91_06835 [Rubripirellula sp.]